LSMSIGTPRAANGSSSNDISSRGAGGSSVHHKDVHLTVMTPRSLGRARRSDTLSGDDADSEVHSPLRRADSS
jgi:hypothetical protein